MATGLLIHGIIFLVLPLYSSWLRMTINGTAMKIWRDGITMEAGKTSKAFEARQARIAFETSIGSQHLKRSKDVKEWSKFPEFFFEGISGQTHTNQSGDGSVGGGDGMVASVHPPPPPPPVPPPSTEPTIKVKITDKIELLEVLTSLEDYHSY